MPFRESFDCLWCGRAHQTRSSEDLEGWAALCPDCVGRAGDNGFLRFRLHAAIEERARASRGSAIAVAEPPPGRGSPVDTDAEMKAYYAARAPEYDDWYLRRGRYSRGPVLDMAWHRELDEVTTWLDRLPLAGEIVELAAGTGWWSPLLAQKGELSLYDVNAEPLDLARRRLVAHGLRAHLHVRDAWDEPDREVDAVFCGFWLSHVRRTRLLESLRLALRWLKPGGRLAFIDSRPDPQSGAVDHPPPQADLAVRRLDDGREFTIPKVFYTRDELTEALVEAGFRDPQVSQTERFFVMGHAARPMDEMER
jgi:demethylmenaquinone methyltransferase/2-methoxy-6-polyprenyl-1,4-benzoquinol methylase